MGGLWEAGVKSFKAHFYKYTAAGKYTFEELATLLAKIEACLNSRPISPMSEDPTDLVALSPGHFLIGGPLLAVSEPLIEENPISIINRWRRLKALHQQFCVRWKEEYLKELHKRNKWKFPSRDLQAGDMVVIKEESLPANEWRLGRIQLIRVYNGSNDPPKSSSLIREQCIQMPSLQGSPRSEGFPTVSSTAIGEAAPRVQRGVIYAMRLITRCYTSTLGSLALRDPDKGATHPRPQRQSQQRQQAPVSGSRRPATPMDMSPSRSRSCTPILARTSVSILPTASVLIGSDQKRFDVRALVDPCCPVSRIHISLVKALNLAITGIGDQRVCTTGLQDEQAASDAGGRADADTNAGAIAGPEGAGHVSECHIGG
ncbi:uncharacterized protein [Drosophila kikkawai]|uniref:DUF5641 domain-containing protein n=1 Tax=Drosophila kikkawai TaxID=30033 RepID=A0ABM4GG21_DROKI